MREYCLRWFGHVYKKPKNVVLRKIGDFKTANNEETITKETWLRTRKNDLVICNLTEVVVLNCRESRDMIYVTNPFSWDITFSDDDK